VDHVDYLFSGWLEHAVADNDFVTGQTTGIYRSACGHRVAAQPMICPPGRRCLGCARTVAAVNRRPPRITRRRAWWLRLRSRLPRSQRVIADHLICSGRVRAAMGSE